MTNGKNLDGTEWKVKSKLIITCNPDSAGYITKEFWKPLIKEGKKGIDPSTGTSYEDRIFITSLYSDNL